MSPEFNETFERSEALVFGGQPMRLTDAGIWLATPLDVIPKAFEALDSVDFWSRFGASPKALDAGMGDGRLVAALGLAGASRWAFGIEADPVLCKLAQDNLRRLTEPGSSMKWRTCRGDFLDPATYSELGVSPKDIDAFFNFPDGSERELARFLNAHGREGARLVLLTPDLGLELEELAPEHEIAVIRGAGIPDYRILVHRVQSQ